MQIRQLGLYRALRIVGRSAGVDVVSMTQYAYCTMDVEPAWDLRPTGWRVRVRGDATSTSPSRSR